MVGGEVFPGDLARLLVRSVGGRVTNMYGPTETTIWSSTEDVADDTDAATSVSIGHPLANQRMYILDERQQPLPPGLAGELVIGGAGVVRGTGSEPELTEERFLPDSFAGTGRMYRTGDLARFLPDGRIAYLGRMDQQVKIRGYRVELGEIETVLRAHEQVIQAAALVREDVAGDQRLVAYVHLAAGADVSDEGFKSWLRAALPDFMVPSAYVRMEDLPLTPNGKIDRKSLPPPPVLHVELSGEIAPKSDTEAMIAAIWQRALGVGTVGTRVNFFDIGGHSLLVMQVLNELREKVTKPVRMTDLFKYTTIEALARYLSDEQAPDRPSIAAGKGLMPDARRRRDGAGAEPGNVVQRAVEPFFLESYLEHCARGRLPSVLLRRGPSRGQCVMARRNRAGCPGGAAVLCELGIAQKCLGMPRQCLLSETPPP